MQLKDLIDCYKFNNLFYERIINDNETIVIHITPHLKIVCKNNNEFINSIQLVSSFDRSINNIEDYIVQVYKWIRVSVDCLCQLSQKEIDIILCKLKLFINDTEKVRKIEFNNSYFEKRIIKNAMIFTIFNSV